MNQIDHKVIYVAHVKDCIRHLAQEIRRESNKKERARLEDEQAALKLTLRVIPQYRVRITGAAIRVVM